MATDERMKPPAKPGAGGGFGVAARALSAAANHRDDALAAWLGSRVDCREEETVESFAAVRGQDAVDEVDRAFDTLDVAFDALVSAAVR
jgi:hypothetical protein